MTKDDIIKLARVAGVRDDGHRFEFSEYTYLEHFAALVAKHERKAIVEVINKLMIEVDRIPHTATTKSANATVRVVGKKFVDLIRARGNT
jgi:hypothetical protein